MCLGYEDGIVQKPLAGSAPDTTKILKDTNAWIKERGWNTGCADGVALSVPSLPCAARWASYYADWRVP